MIFKNLHQPYIFVKEGYYHTIVSEILQESFKCQYGEAIVEEEMWKLRYIDEERKIYNIITPEEIEFDDGSIYYRVAECSGYIDTEGNMSYILSAHNKKNDGNYVLFLIRGVFDFNKKSVENYKVLGSGIRSAFVNKNRTFAYSQYDQKIYLNGVDIFDTNQLNSSVIRIMGVYDNEDSIIITVIDDNNLYKSYLLNIKTLQFKKITNKNENDIIYKCSIIGQEDIGFIAYTDKVFNIDSVSLESKQYFLNYEQGYILK